MAKLLILNFNYKIYIIKTLIIFNFDIKLDM